eukprot:TRINITY_DN3908_c0_g4_i3.p1 TRINITY_DN3908_c0_g4~~TRINITY_DN3908_c0_g4_i3.p1  ORF type:complete len:300 (-),score=48.08 TRINITY_DN3908_c0_g4_i3:354-1253(-)
MPIGVLDITVLSARDLKETEYFGTQDPYFVLLCGQYKWKSKTDNDGGKKPTWNERNTFQLTDEGVQSVRIDLYNKNSLSDDDYIAGATIPLQQAFQTGKADMRIPLTRKSGKSGGELAIIIHFTQQGGAPYQQPYPPQQQYSSQVAQGSAVAYPYGAPSAAPAPSLGFAPPPGAVAAGYPQQFPQPAGTVQYPAAGVQPTQQYQQPYQQPPSSVQPQQYQQPYYQQGPPPPYQPQPQPGQYQYGGQYQSSGAPQYQQPPAGYPQTPGYGQPYVAPQQYVQPYPAQPHYTGTSNWAFSGK